MNITHIRPGDIVECDRNGLKFFAKVEDTAKGELSVEPITRGITYRTVTARQVVCRYRKCKNGSD